MLSLSPEPRARGGKVPEGPSPPRGCALRGPGGSTCIKEARSSAEHRAAPGKPRPRREPLRGAGCRVSRVQSRGPGRAALRATGPPARPPAHPGRARTSHKRRHGGSAGRCRPLPPGTLRTSQRSSAAPSPWRRRRPRRRRRVGASPGSASALPAADGSRPRVPSARS